MLAPTLVYEVLADLTKPRKHGNAGRTCKGTRATTRRKWAARQLSTIAVSA